jgi:SAM-dependent methyltransferase
MLKALMYEIQYENYSPDFSMYETLLDINIPVIEFGSGTGRITNHLLQKGYTVFGIEKDEDYKKYFIHKIQAKPFADRFRYIKDIRDVSAICNIIYPFNVFFYLSEKDVRLELNKLQNHYFNLLIIDTDNIFTLKNNNLSKKEHATKEFCFKEQSLLKKTKVIIQCEVLKGEELILKFKYHLYLHKADFLLSLYEKHFKKFKLYGDFNMNNYDGYSNKLIAVIKQK